MANAVENGRQWLSLVEKFVSYFSTAIGFAAIQVFTSGMEMAWGWHFMHNFTIALMRYDDNGIYSGFYSCNLLIDNKSNLGSIASELLASIVNVGAVYSVCSYLEDRREQFFMI